ncbi:MAG TPA: DMT family transporter [Candidatus Polarisedimenticolia bacterium]|nr:DMT family transporter [Candidatus Polarisedimenticolia bacterium]
MGRARAALRRRRGSEGLILAATTFLRPGADEGLVGPLPAIARRPRLAALLGAMCIAFSGIFYRWADVSPETATVFRCLYGLPILALVAWLEQRRHGPLPASTVRLAAIAGVFFAGDLTFWHHAVDAVGAGLATVLGNLQVIVVGIVAWLFLGERPTRQALLAIPIVLVGVVLISGLVGVGAYGADPRLGVVLGVITAICYAGYLIVIRRGGRDGRRAAGPVAISTASTAIVAALVGIALNDLNPIPSWPNHGWLALLGVTSQSAGYLLISISLPRLPSLLVSILLLSQPVVTVILARFLLNETPSPIQVLGAVLVLGGIALATVPAARVRGAVRSAVRRPVDQPVDG